jgi:glutamine synthetase adenylyltransferase
MANTIGTTNANVIAQRALEILVADYSFLRNCRHRLQR